MSGANKRVLLAKPRGYCAGVDRAVEAVEQALEQHGPPVYVRKQIVHNVHVVRDARPSAARSSSTRPTRCRRVRSWCSRRTACRPRCATRRASASCARSTPPARWSPRCTRRPSGSPARTTTSCSSATTATRRSRAPRARRPTHIQLVETAADVAGVTVRDPEKVVWLSQTTLVGRRDDGHRARAARAVPHAAEPAERRHLLRHAEPAGRGEGDGAAVRPRAGRGLANSSNSVRLVEVALQAGAGAAHLIDYAREIDERGSTGWARSG